MRKDIIRAALGLGLTVERVYREYLYEDQRQYGILRKRLIICGNLCHLSEIRSRAKKHAGRGGFLKCTYASLCLYRYLVVRLMLPDAWPRTFVIPTEVLRDALFADAPQRLSYNLFVPVMRENGIETRINLDPYEHAWHLISAVEKAAA